MQGHIKLLKVFTHNSPTFLSLVSYHYLILQSLSFNLNLNLKESPNFHQNPLNTTQKTLMNMKEQPFFPKLLNYKSNDVY